MDDLLEVYDVEKDCKYRDETYRVRNNGSIFRCPKPDKSKRPLDGKWTFGRPDKQKGYLNFSSETVHRIVATAFLGDQPSEKHIVDHIDTNKKNNRPENLRWITRLDNILRNPITLSRIIYKYGSIDNFRANPSKPINGELEQNFNWMRTVTKEESENTRKNLINLANEGKTPTGRQLGEWIFSQTGHREALEIKEDSLIKSLTPMVWQKNWTAPSEFPSCLKEKTTDPIANFADRIEKNTLFFKTSYYSTSVLKKEIIDGGKTLLVMYEINYKERDQKWGIMKITFDQEKFICGIVPNYNGSTLDHYNLEDTKNHFSAIINSTKWTPLYDSQGRKFGGDYMPL